MDCAAMGGRCMKKRCGKKLRPAVACPSPMRCCPAALSLENDPDTHRHAGPRHAANCCRMGCKCRKLNGFCVTTEQSCDGLKMYGCRGWGCRCCVPFSVLCPTTSTAPTTNTTTTGTFFTTTPATTTTTTTATTGTTTTTTPTTTTTSTTPATTTTTTTATTGTTSTTPATTTTSTTTSSTTTIPSGGSCDCGRFVGGRVVGGNDAMSEQAPYVFKLVANYATCSASFIHPKFILTAAHCVHKNGEAPTSLQVLHGSVTADQLTAAPWREIYVDDRYPGDNKYDIAVIELEEELDYTNIPNLHPVCVGREEDNPALDSTVTVAGWGIDEATGATLATTLQVADLTVASEDEWFINTDGPTAYAYAGDGGGPLVVTSSSGVVVQVGITSLGAPPTNTFVKVSVHRPWLETIIGELCVD